MGKKREKENKDKYFSTKVFSLKIISILFSIALVSFFGLLTFPKISEGVSHKLKNSGLGLFTLPAKANANSPVFIAANTDESIGLDNVFGGLSLSNSAAGNQSYLTINAETKMSGPLRIDSYLSSGKFISSPLFFITDNKFKGSLGLSGLSADRTYKFPDQSGTVCLSTGNCIGIKGEVISYGGTLNRLTKFISSKKIGNSSIADFYNGVAITISPSGNVGIGVSSSQEKLAVGGGISAKNIFVSNNVGIGGKNSEYPLYVKGKIKATGDICTSLNGGKCLSQLSTAIAAPILSGGSGGKINGSGSINYIPLWSSQYSLENSIIYQSGSALTINGAGDLKGPLKIETNSFPQLLIKYNGNDYSSISVDSNGSLIFNSSGKKIRAVGGSTFYTSGGNPIRKSGELILKASVPIFLYSFPSQTESNSFIKISKHFSSNSEMNLPPKEDGTERVYKLAIRYVDNLPLSSGSTWRVWQNGNSISTDTFTLPGRNILLGHFSDDSGVSYITRVVNIPSSDWELDVKVPTGGAIRVFNIYLLVYDKIK